MGCVYSAVTPPLINIRLHSVLAGESKAPSGKDKDTDKVQCRRQKECFPFPSPSDFVKSA